MSTVNKNNYLTNKSVYLDLLNITHTGKKDIDKFDDIPQIFRDIIAIESLLHKTYEQFWRSIYYDDAYIYYKHAIRYYRNNRDNFNKIISDDASKMISQTMIFIDKLIDMTPTIPENVQIYNCQYTNINTISEFKKGSIYKSSDFMYGSMSPFTYINNKNLTIQKKIGASNSTIESIEGYMQYMGLVYSIIIPKGSKGLYLSNHFEAQYDGDINKVIGIQTNEILLPRESMFEIVSVEKYGDIICIEMIYRAQTLSNEFTETNPTIAKNNFKTQYHKQFKYDNELNMRELCMFNVSEIASWNKNTMYDPNKHSYLNDKDFNKLVKWYLKYNISKNHSLITSKYLYTTLELCYNTLRSLNINNAYIGIVTGLHENSIIDIEYPFVLSSVFDESMYHQNINILKREIPNSSINDRYQADNELYTIDNVYPRFCIIKISSDKVSWLKMTDDSGIIMGAKIKIVTIEKISLSSDTFGYFIYGKII